MVIYKFTSFITSKMNGNTGITRNSVWYTKCTTCGQKMSGHTLLYKEKLGCFLTDTTCVPLFFHFRCKVYE